MAELHCTVAIPTRELFSGEIAYASVPSVDGYYGVLPGHEMMVATNRSGGVLTINLDEAGNDQREFLLYEGASQVMNDTLTVIGRFGVEVDKIDTDEIKKKADALREELSKIEDAEEAQKKVSYRTNKKLLEWYELQIRYKEGKSE